MFKLWSLCLMKASHKESRFIFNGQEIAVSSGQFVTGRAVIEKSSMKVFHVTNRLSGVRYGDG